LYGSRHQRQRRRKRTIKGRIEDEEGEIEWKRIGRRKGRIGEYGAEGGDGVGKQGEGKEVG
jgi:hypothetical protein